MPSSTPRRRWSLTRYFAVVSVLAMAALGLALVLVTSNLMREQSVRSGTAAATSVMAFAVDPLPAEVFASGLLTPEQTLAVEESTANFGNRVVELRLWSTVGQLMYSSSGAATGFPDTERFNSAISSARPNAEVVVDVNFSGGTETDAGTVREVLDVYVPVRFSDTAGAAPGAEEGAEGPSGDDLVGAAEVMLDYTDTAAALRDAVQTVTIVVAVGLIALWLLLFRTVHSTSRRLQATALENARLALLDSLTGLPNRRLLAERMQKTVSDARETGGRLGLVLLDIDRFKDINDSLGHDHGDELLEQVAERLRGALRDDDVVARLGGDEFAILLPDVHSVANAERLAHRVRELFGPPFQLGEMSLHVETSIGVACLPDHASDASSLMRTADVAMYTAKHHRTGVAVYDSEEDHSSPSRLVLLGDLHRALDRSPGTERQLAMHYQPKIDLDTGQVVGHEALMRWVHPEHGVLAPNFFIPLAEQSGLIHSVTRYALEEVVEQLSHWAAEGRRLPVAVNLSAHDVTTPGVVDQIEQLVERFGLEHRMLEVEITETALVADPSRVVPVLQRLSDLGVAVAIDDFGIGTTSISQLRDLPVASLKIDRLFVADLGDGGKEGSKVVVQAMVDLAHSFGLTVVAEGVEDRETALVLQSLGVDQAQGFLYSTAVPARDVREGDILGPPDAPVPSARGRSRGGRTSARQRPARSSG